MNTKVYLWGYFSMVRLILYKNCKLNNKYQEVMFLGEFSNSNKTSLDLYLESLTSQQYEINDIYYENSGEFVFPLDLNFNPYEYNYMKVLSYSGSLLILERYCFINSIECKNGAVYLKYEEDIWHSYSKNIIGCQKSFLERSRLGHYNSIPAGIKELPVEYDGNNELVINKLISSNTDTVVCLVQLQLYQLVSGTDAKNIRYNEFAIMAPVVSSETRYDYNIPNMKLVIETLLQNMTSGDLVKNVLGVGVNFKYQVGNIYFLPASCFGYHNLTFTEEHTSYGIKYKYVEQTDALAKGIIDKSSSISNNYKNLFVGTYKDFIGIKNNGTPTRYETKIFMSGVNFVWQLNCANQIIDISNTFKYQAPFTPILADEFAQRKIGLELEEYKLEMQKAKDITSGTIGNILDIWSSIGNIIVGAFTHTSQKNSGNANSNAGLLGQGRNISSSYGNIIDNFVYRIPTLNKMIDSIKSPKYSNAKGNVGSSNNLANYYGLIIAKINPDNSNYVKQAVDLSGYVVYNYVSDSDTYKINDILKDKNNFIGLSATYDYIKFGYINVYGKFTNEIADKLNQILENGIRIWYSYNFTDDNFTDNLL